MRRTVRILVVTGLLAALATVGSAGPASAGFPTTTLSLTKVVVGQEYAPAGAEWVIDASCIAMPAQTFTLGDLGPREFSVDPSATCTVTESGTAGAASVAYTCDVVPPAGGLGTVASCTVSDQGVTIEFEDGPEVDSAISVTVTNTYTPPPTPASPAPAPGVVAAQPAFTG
jgi:hypothetical protein